MISKDPNAQSVDSMKKAQNRARFRVELSPEAYQSVRQESLRTGKHMKVITSEIVQTHFGNNSTSNEPPEPPPSDPEN
ncbi:MAG: hypothetical protein ACO3NK_10635 [Prochlorotrichaceae cyanobacterium]|jgi:hypothetical protein